MTAPHRINLPITWSTNYYSGAKTWPILYPTQEVIDPMKQWCQEVLGPNEWNYYGHAHEVPFQFRFKREEDLLAFRLWFGV